MTLEDQIAALLAEAEPLRCLDDDDPKKEALGPLVDRINALRAMESAYAAGQYRVVEELGDAPQEIQEPKRRGRPPKSKQEGADA